MVTRSVAPPPPFHGLWYQDAPPPCRARGADVMQGYYLLEVSLAPTGAPALRCTTCCQCFEAFRSTG
eukprot:s5366_g3.t1